MNRIAAAHAALLMLGACTGGEPYPEDMRADFIETCTASNPGVPGAEQVCTCVIDQSEKRMSYETFRDLDAALQAGRATSQQRSLLTSIFQTCVERNS